MATLNINGRDVTVDVRTDMPILWVLPDVVGLTARITTIDAIGDTPSGKKIQQAWLDHEVVQCGYCQSGQIMSATALLAKNVRPSDADIDAAMSGNICRLGTYPLARHG